MSFTTAEFFVFVTASILVYFLYPREKEKWLILLIASYVFYLFAGFKYAFYILITTVSTYLIALWLEKYAEKSKKYISEQKGIWSAEEKKKYKNKVQLNEKLIASLALVINFGILVFIKYYNFFAGSLNSLFHVQTGGLPMLKLVLPLGISFYTFQSMGYLIDVLRGKIKAEKCLGKFALFVSFFPQIIQGPISAYGQLANQLYEPHKFDFTRFKYGAELILWGYFKKLVIADRLVIAINTYTADYSAFNGTTALFVVLLYAVQLYADFSAGIDISRGIAQIIGIDMVQNFKRPYFSKSINEYWRRWHITLGVWMKEYIFYPIAMSKTALNQGKKIRNSKFGKTDLGNHISKVYSSCVAMFVVFLVVGLWHGANWKYVGFGLWNGLAICISMCLSPVFESLAEKLHINVESFGFGLFQIFRTLIVVLIGYVFDVAPSLSGSFNIIGQVFADQNLAVGYSQIKTLGLLTVDYAVVALSCLVLFTVSVIQEKHSEESLRVMLDKRSAVIRLGLIIMCICFILVFGIYGPGYDPAEFVYMQF